MALDISKGKSYYVVYQGRNCVNEGEMTHTQEGFQTLTNILHQLDECPEIVFEATGVYSSPVATFCQKNQLTYYELNPLQAKGQLEKETLRSWKTDKHDAHKLAQTHWNNTRVQTTPASPQYKELRDLSRFYQEVTEEISRINMHLHNTIQLTFPELELFLTNRLTPYGLTLIQLYPHPQMVLAHSKTKIKNQLMQSTPKKIAENRAKNKAEEILNYAQNSYPAVSVEDIHVQKTHYFAKLLQQLLLQKEELAQQMITVAKKLAEFQLFASFPGIGELSAAQLIGELGDLRRFATSKKANAYIGIDIKRYQSGKYFGQDRSTIFLKRMSYTSQRSITIRNMLHQIKTCLFKKRFNLRKITGFKLFSLV